MCVQPKQTQPLTHSRRPVGVQTTGASGSCQTDQCKLRGNLSRGSDTPLLSVGKSVNFPTHFFNSMHPMEVLMYFTEIVHMACQGTFYHLSVVPS